MSKHLEYAVSVVTFVVILIIYDVVFKVGFFEELNIANAFITVFVGGMVVAALSGKRKKHND